ncbi:MAG TPA: primosomal protein N' [Gammaproteobacteria bacterium]|nr:primosomal protein N' [Gammaproteobacteria bacterium]
MTESQKRVRVAVPVPVARGFDYGWDRRDPLPRPGTRVRVPFGKRERIGIVIGRADESAVDDAALKTIREVIDARPLLEGELMESLLWASSYYHHPVGEVLAQALPGLLRRGRAAEVEPERGFALSAAGSDADRESLGRRAPRQAEALELIARSSVVATSELSEAGISGDTLRRLCEKGLIVPAERPEPPPAATQAQGEAPPELTADQAAAVEAARATSGFACALLYGVTGSGKTEVFLRLIGDALERGRQCLLLVPEIGLTPQLVRRLRARFGSKLAVFHSGLTDAQRLTAWRQARSGEARLIVGTRSAAFAPLPAPGLIVVDEEHDPSYKQQSGFRYSGRDLAIIRARTLDIPVVLASATPSLESFRNAAEGRYRLLTLPRRIGAAGTPGIRVVDLNQHAVRQGLSTPLLSAMEQHLGRGDQALLFINRRGFAPVLFCASCEKASECRRCDSRMTVHARAGELRCHHCGSHEPLHWTCPDCGSERIGVGAGTERVTSELEQLYPAHAIARLDRDAVSGRDSLERVLDEIESGRASIIVGTQLLTKGHDFPNVTLVGVLNADQGLFGTDFRSEERLAQTVIQVAGRAGRRDRPGEVLIQTHHPNHPLLRELISGDYGAFAERALAERRATAWPPFSRLAVFRAEARERDRVFAFLGRLARHSAKSAHGVRVLGPAPDRMERRDGRFRGQLLLQSGRRDRLHVAIRSCLDVATGWPEARRVRWSIDVDPVEL